MSEHDAHKALSDTARMRMLIEPPADDAKPMTFSERQYRAREARVLYVAGMVADQVEAEINAIAKTLNVETATGAALDALAGIPQREPDFRDGRCPHGNIDFTCHVCAVEQARTHDWGG
jgi:hypothetical protein